MIRSMTGFGRGESTSSNYQISCEIKGVNHRYFDFNLRMYKRYNSLEDKIRDKIKQNVGRGRIEIFINVEKIGEGLRNIKVDNDLAMIYHNSLKDLAIALGLDPIVDIVEVFKLPEVYVLEEKDEDLELIWEVMEAALDDALLEFVDMRIREGQALAADIREKNQYILQAVDNIAERAPLVVSEYSERMKKRLQELMLDVAIDENRIFHEVAIFADRAGIDEEIVRLRSHCAQTDGWLLSDEQIGKKCDFLVQEMLREVNTIASKANDLTIGRTTVDLKAEIEKIREQIQNLE